MRALFLAQHGVRRGAEDTYMTLLTFAQAMDILTIKRTALYHLIKAEKLRVYKIGGSKRLCLEDIHEYIRRDED